MKTVLLNDFPFCHDETAKSAAISEIPYASMF